MRWTLVSIFFLALAGKADRVDHQLGTRPVQRCPHPQQLLDFGTATDG